jgi:uncharacterized protein (TIGR02284 family)
MQNDAVVKVLNNLIQTSEDGKMGFAEAADQATKPELKSLFRQRSADCETAAVELQAIVRSLGGSPEHSGTIVEAAHRGWAKVKTTVSDPNIGMLEEVERAEDKAKAVYAQALKSDLPISVLSVVRTQHEGAVRNHDVVRDLRNTYRAAKAA